MTKKKKNVSEMNTLFVDRVGACGIAMCLDARHPEQTKKPLLPLCIRFTIFYKRYYHLIGEKYTTEQIARIAQATGQGEQKRIGIETNFERQVRLQQVFANYVNTVSMLNETGALTLDRIKTALTGRCESTSFIATWEEVVQEKREMDKVGTANNYELALKNFKRHTGVDYVDGFAIDDSIVKRWVDAMTADNLSKTTQGIYLRACRLVVYRCIGEGHLLPKANMFAKGKDKVKIPNGNSRKGCYLSIGQMTDLYDHLINRDLNLPIYDQRLGRNNPKNYVKSKKNLEYIYQALAMFLMQYLACGCNLFDLALLRYDNYYFDSNRRAFRFIRRKSQDETLDGEGMEVVVPITKEMQAILNLYAAKPEHNQLVFPFLMGDAITGSAQNQYDKVHQENKNIADRMKKVAACLEWTINPTGTYARHSFATNLHAAKVPMEYISDAMGHSLGNTGQITKRYISAYTVEERLAYNNKLLDKPAYNSRTSSDATERIENAGQPMSETRQKLMNIINSYSDETLRSMIIEKRNREMTDLGLG